MLSSPPKLIPFATLVVHLRNAPCCDRVKPLLAAAAAAICTREGFVVVLMFLQHQQMERKLHSQNTLSYIMALESQRRVRKGVHSECSGRVHDVSAKCHALERCQLSRGPRSACGTHCRCWLLSSSPHCAPAAEGSAVALSPMDYSVCLSVPANPTPGDAGGAGKRSVRFLPMLG